MNKDAIEYAANVYRLLAEQKLIVNLCKKEMTVTALEGVFEKAGFLYNEEMLAYGVAFINRQDDVEEIKRIIGEHLTSRQQIEQIEVFVLCDVRPPYLKGSNWNFAVMPNRAIIEMEKLGGSKDIDVTWKLDEFLARDLSVLGFTPEHGVQESANLKTSCESIIETVKLVAKEQEFSIPSLKIRGRFFAAEQRWFFGVFLE